MLKDLKSKRRLSLFVALALSAGGALFSDFQYAYAADVSGNDVLVDFTPAHPLPTVPPPSGGAITDPADNGNVYNNKLTVDGPNFVGQSLCGGFTAGAGNVTGNTVVVKNAANIWGDAYIYMADSRLRGMRRAIRLFSAGTITTAEDTTVCANMG